MASRVVASEGLSEVKRGVARTAGGKDETSADACS
jgi:hypothetical protein